MKNFNPDWLISVAVVASFLFSAPVYADTPISSASNPNWKAECGSCHVAYPPSLLPADSWRALMSSLDQHFGVDASVDTKSAVEIGAFLVKHAGKARGVTAKPILRITATPWFKHEHDEVNAALWQHALVKTPANCAACHRAAEQGNFSERGIHLPK